MNKTATKRPKTRCFFANLYFRESVCDSNHKNRFQKSSTIPLTAHKWASTIGNSFVFN